MGKEELEEKIDKITFSELVSSGIPSNCMGLVLQQYQKTYGTANVWTDSNGIYIKTKVNAKIGGK